MFDDLWNSSAFDLVEMTNAINLLPRQGDDISAHVPFTEDSVLTNDFALDVTKFGQIELVPASDLGAPGDLMADDEHSTAVRFPIPYFVRRAQLQNFEVMGARIPGSRSLKILTTERDKKLVKLKSMFDATKAHQRWTSLFGIVLDCNGKVLVNTLHQFKLERTRMRLKVASDAANALDDQLVDAKVKIERILGFKPRGYKFITTEGGNKVLRKSKVYKEQRTDPLSNYLNRQDGRKGVTFADDVEVVYFQSPFVDETKNLLVPIFDDCARTVNGPSLSSQFWGTVLPYYVTKKNLDHDEGVEMKGSMRTISYTTRPDAIFEVEIVE